MAQTAKVRERERDLNFFVFDRRVRNSLQGKASVPKMTTAVKSQPSKKQLKWPRISFSYYNIT